MSASRKTGSMRHKLQDRGHDCYETPAQAVHTLLRVEGVPDVVWEPACGPGAIVRILRATGRHVIATDLIDYGLEASTAGVDFLMERRAPEGCATIITNPPYKLATEFIRHGLTLCPTVIMLLRLAYLESANNRSDLLDQHLDTVWLGRERLPMMHRMGWEGAKVDSGAMPFAWFVFTQRRTHGEIRLRRMSWRDSPNQL